MEVGDEEKSEEMAKKLSQCCRGSENGLLHLLSFPTWMLVVSRNMKKWLKSYPTGGRLVRMNFATFSLFLHRRGRWVGK